MSEMWEANLTFKREERDGVVPVGTYLSDAAGRLGVRADGKCLPVENIHFCRLSVLEGADLLSEPTRSEAEILSSEPGEATDRLACQAKIIEPGDIVLMTTETKTDTPEASAEEAAKEYTKEFTELPLEKKISQLVQLEAIALGETISFVVNSPFLIFEKAIDVMAQFGLKKEEQDRKAARPAEHAAASEEAEDGSDREAETESDSGVAESTDA